MQFEVPTKETMETIAAMAMLTSFSSDSTSVLSYETGIQGEIPVYTGKIVSWTYSTRKFVYCHDQTRALPVFSNAARFQQYIKAWHLERGATSSIPEMVMCRSHLRIIAMGAAIALPLIFAQMESENNEPDMWFAALQILTGTDPVTDEIRGDFKAMADRWLEWAADNGYAW
jgi:hypothetical protein